MLHLGYKAFNFSANRPQASRAVGNLGSAQSDLSVRSADAGSGKAKDDDDDGVPQSARPADTLSSQSWITLGDDV